MPIRKEKDRRTGRTHLLLEKCWPYRSGRFRRRFKLDQQTIARDLDRKIESACADGTWPELKRQLDDPPPKPVTVAEFADVYFEQYCKKENRAPEFKTYVLKPIKRIVGHIPMIEFTRADGHHYKKERGKDGVANATVNHGIAVLSNMFAFAIEEGIITMNPLLRFRKLPKPEPKESFMSLEEERRLVQAVMDKDLDVGLLTGVIGETGLRLDDALCLTWAQLDLERRLLIKQTSKRLTVVHIPLSDYAIELLAQVPRIVGSPWVFTTPGTRDPMKERSARWMFDCAKGKAKLGWNVSFHDLRRFRATQWHIHGVDLKTIQGLLGHKRIETTMLYVKFAPAHAVDAVTSAQKREREAAVATANK